MLMSMSGSFTLQGRQLCGDDIDLIRQLIAAHPDWHRSRLSVELCRMWDWRTDKGLLKDMACRSMLRKLEQRRLIVLPAARVIGNRARRIREMALCRDPIVCPLEQLQPIVIAMVTGRGEADDLFHCLLDRYHYLGCRGHVGEHIKYLVYDRQKRPLGGLLFGAAAWKVSAREQFIGWSDHSRQGRLKFLANNTRFLILPWVKVANLASFILGACLRRLPGDWITRYGHELFLVETFVDRSRFTGTCYRAANWLYVGATRGRSRQDRYKRLRVPVKDLYVYPLTGQFRQRLCS
jgi:hypothetical protein